jgi:hypothetical protein
MWRAKGSIKSKETDKWLLREDICDLLLQLVLEVKPELKLTVEEFSANKPAPNSEADSIGLGQVKLESWQTG